MTPAAEYVGPDEIEIVGRATWGAAPPRYRHYIDTPSAELWLHHSAGTLDAGGNGTWWDDLRGIQDFHMRPEAEGGRGWSDIAYSFLVGGGMIFEGRGVGVAGGHTAGRNTISHAICVIGNYETMVPLERDLHAVARLIRHGQRHGWWGDLTGPHRDAPGALTACCGKNLIARIPDLRRMAKEDTDMPLTDADLDKIEARLLTPRSDRSSLRDLIVFRSGELFNATNSKLGAILNAVNGVAAEVGADPIDEAALVAELAPALIAGLDIEGAVQRALTAAGVADIDEAAVGAAVAADIIGRLTT